MPYPLIDIGANLTHDSFEADRGDVIQRAADAGVTRIIVTGSSDQGNIDAADLAAEYPGRLFATAAARASGLSVYDTQCGMKLLRLSIAPTQVLEEPFTVNWAFDVELMLRLKQATSIPVGTAPGLVLKEVPLSTWTDIGRSSVTSLAGARAFLDLFLLYWRYRR